MELVIGGRAQGKLEYAKKISSNNKIIDNFALIVKNLMECEDNNLDEFVEEFIKDHQDYVVILEEIGLGLVPIDKKEREYRDKYGRLCCRLVECATRVHRVYCGIGSVIKDA